MKRRLGWILPVLLSGWILSIDTDIIFTISYCFSIISLIFVYILVIWKVNKFIIDHFWLSEDRLFFDTYQTHYTKKWKVINLISGLLMVWGILLFLYMGLLQSMSNNFANFISEHLILEQWNYCIGSCIK